MLLVAYIIYLIIAISSFPIEIDLEIDLDRLYILLTYYLLI